MEDAGFRLANKMKISVELERQAAGIKGKILGDLDCAEITSFRREGTLRWYADAAQQLLEARVGAQRVKHGRLQSH